MAFDIKINKDVYFNKNDLIDTIEHWKEIPHDTPYHKETIGDHIFMVANQLKDSNLYLAGLLHDIGKPFVKNGGRYTGHNSIGIWLARSFLNQENALDMLYYIWLHMSYHRKEKASFEWVNLPPDIYKNLKKLCKADAIGTISENDKKKTYQDINLYEYKFHTFNTNKPICYIMWGLPGVGKSTYIKNNMTNLPIVSRDDIIEEIGKGDNYIEKYKHIDHKLVDKIFWNQIKSQKNDFIIDITSNTKKLMRRIINNIKGKFNIKFIMILSDIFTVIERNKNRTGKNIPENVIWDKAVKTSLPPYHLVDRIILN